MAEKAVAQPKTFDLATAVAEQVVPMNCGCDGCEALTRLYGSDPELHLFYRRRLLQRGWAGNGREPEERLYQQHHLSWAAAKPSGMPLFGKKRRAGDAPESEDEESGVDALDVPV
jgi:hypothetical protein